jgi:hypothetical protein
LLIRHCLNSILGRLLKFLSIIHDKDLLFSKNYQRYDKHK